MKIIPPHKAAFTLIELLVVIVIIGILVAIILPVFQSTMKTSKSVKSISNLKQLGVGIASWSSDNDGYIIFTRGNPGVSGNGWWFDALTKYVGEVQSAGARPAGVWANSLSSFKNTASTRSDYGKNIHLNEVHPNAAGYVVDPERPVVKFLNLDVPSRIFLLAESGQVDVSAKIIGLARDLANYSRQGNIADYIEKKSNVLFCDLSVRALNPKDPTQVTPSGGYNDRLPPWRPTRGQ